MKRSYEEICEDLRNATPGAEARKLHKELKEYGDGLSLLDRYPEIPFVIMVLAIVIAVLSIISLVI